MKKVYTSELVKREYQREIKRIKSFVRRAEKRGYSFNENAIPTEPAKINNQYVNKLKNLTHQKLYKKSTHTNAQNVEISGTEARKIERKLAAQKAAKTRLERIQTGFYEFKKKGDGYISRTDIILTNTDYAISQMELGTSPDYKDYAKARKINYQEEPAETRMSIQANNIDELNSEISNWTPASNWSPSLVHAKSRDKSRLKSIFDSARAEIGDYELAMRLEEHAAEINELVQEILYASGSKEGNFKDGRTQVNADINRFTQIILGRSLTVDESIIMTEQAEQAEFDE